MRFRTSLHSSLYKRLKVILAQSSLSVCLNARRSPPAPAGRAGHWELDGSRVQRTHCIAVPATMHEGISRCCSQPRLKGAHADYSEVSSSLPIPAKDCLRAPAGCPGHWELDGNSAMLYASEAELPPGEVLPVYAQRWGCLLGLLLLPLFFSSCVPPMSLPDRLHAPRACWHCCVTWPQLSFLHPNQNPSQSSFSV